MHCRTIILQLLLILTYAQNSIGQISLKPGNCANGKLALVDSNGTKVSDCVYTNIIRHQPKEELKKYEQSFISGSGASRFLVGEVQPQTWVLIDSTGQQVPGATMSYDKFVRWNVAEIEGVGHQIQYGGLIYMYFDAKNELFGPFKEHWRSRGCVQRGNMDFRYNVLYGRYNLDNELIVFDRQGNQLPLEAGLTEFNMLDESTFSTKNSAGLFQLRKLDCTLFFEGPYKKNAYVQNKGVYSLITTNHSVKEDDPEPGKLIFVDSTGTLLIDTLYSSIAPRPFTSNIYPYSWLSCNHYLASHKDHYVILDKEFNVLLETTGRPITLHSQDIFSIKDTDGKITVYKGDTTQVMFRDLLDYTYYGKNHLVVTTEKAQLLDSLFSPISKSYTQLSVSNLRIKNHTFQFKRSNGELGFLNSDGKEILSLQVDSLFKLSCKNYQNLSIIRDSLISIGKGDTYGVYDLITKQELNLSSEAPIYISNSPDVFIIEKDGKKGAYHFPSGRLIIDKYKSLYVSDPSYRKGGKIFDYTIIGKLSDDSYDRYSLKGDKLYDADNITEVSPTYIPDYRIERNKRKTYLKNGDTYRNILSEGYDKIDTILTGDKSLRYIKLTRGKTVQFLDAELKGLTPKNEEWYRAIFIDSEKTLLNVELKNNRGKVGIYDLDKAEYVIPPQFKNIKSLSNGLLELCGTESRGVATVAGKIIKQSGYYKFYGKGQSPLILAKTSEKTYQILDSDGKVLHENNYLEATPVWGPPAEYGQLFQVKIETDTLSFLIDKMGKRSIDIPDGYYYRTIDGPLDMLVDENKNWVLVKDLTVLPCSKTAIYPGNIPQSELSIESANSFYYLIPTNDGNIIYNQEGRELFSVPQEMFIKGCGHYYHNSEQEFVINFANTGYVKEKQYLSYNLSGQLLTEEFKYGKKNTFGQMQYDIAGNTYVVD